VHLAERIAALPGGRTLLRRRFTATRLSAPAVETAERVRHVLGGDRVDVAALPADVAPAEGPRRAPGAPLRVLFLGRFEPIKGATLLLEAAAHPGAPALEIVLAGAGSEEASLRAMAAHARGPIRFAGVLDGAERNAALHAADVLVAPSRRTRGGRGEGLPHAATLALAAGVPVVTSDGGALARRVRMHDAGAVFDADGDRSAAAARLAAVLARTAADPEVLAAWRRGARAAGAAHRPDHALAAWKRVLTSASASPRGGAPRDVLAMETP